MKYKLMLLLAILMVPYSAAAQDSRLRNAETNTANSNEIIKSEQHDEQEAALKKEGLVSHDIKEAAEIPVPTPTPTPSTSTAQNPIYVRPDFKTRSGRYAKSMFGPNAFIGPLFGAGVGTITNSPPEWGRSVKGYAKRYASGFGKNIIRETTVFALDEAFKLDSHYYRSTKSDFGSRLKHAVVSSFTAKNKNGKRVIGVPRIVGIYTAEITSVKTWYPERYSVQDGLRQGTFSLGTNILNNLVKEFIFR